MPDRCMLCGVQTYEAMHLREQTPFFKLAWAFCILIGTTLSAQENSHWYFGHHAGIDFTNGTAVAETGGLDALEGTATVSDQGGNLLFYTDGVTIRDRNNNVMPNGSSLMGGASSTQAALIVPKPGACGTYYVFTTQDHMQNGDFRYSVIDMCLNNGLGDVVAGEKNIMISTPCGEKVTAVPNSSGTGYWIITHVLGGNAFLAYSLSSSGLNFVPVTSSVGSVQGSTCQIGPLKASHDGTKLVSTNTFCNHAELFDFDAATGVVSNPVDLAGLYGLPNGCYGAEFSPNDELLYISTTWAVNRLYQIDLVNSIVSEIEEGPGGTYSFGALQLGADGRIYMARKDEAFLDVIEFPDIPGTACSYLPAGLTLAAGTTSDIGLPCLIPATVLQADSGTITVDLGPDTSLCDGPVILAPSAVCGDIFLWQDGTVASSFTAAQPGIFWVRVSNSCGVGADTIVVGNGGQALADLGPDTTLCPGGSIVLSVPSGADSVFWQDGSTLDEFTVSLPGIFSVQIFNGGCMGQDTVAISALPQPQAGFSFSLDTCTRTVSFVNTSQGSAAQAWDLDDNTTSTALAPQHTYSAPGAYTVALVVQNGCGTDSLLQEVDIPDIGQLQLNGPDTLCSGTTANYVASLTGTSPSSITWSNGSTDTLGITYGPGSSLWLSVTVAAAAGCILTDSVFITLMPLPIANFTWEAHACGTQVLFSDQSNFATSWAWNLGNDSLSTDPSPTGIYEPPGLYTVVLAAMNDCGSDTATVDMDLTPQGELVLNGPTDLCADETGMYAVDFTGSDIASVAWSTGDIGLSMNYTIAADTVLAVELIGTDGCTYADTLALTVQPLPVANFTWSQNACDSSILFTDGSMHATSTSWDLGFGQSSVQPAPTGHYPGPGSYNVQLVAANSCGSDTTELAVVLDGMGQLLITGPAWVCSDEPVSFTAELSGTDISGIIWSTGDTVPAIALGFDSDQLLSAAAVGADGCHYLASTTISVIGADGDDLNYAPNVFTPNGDGINETFAPVMVDPGAFLEMLIFNRWGQEIYSTTNIQHPWDGRFKGAPVPDGTYVYIMRWMNRCRGTREERHGHVTLLR